VVTEKRKGKVVHRPKLIEDEGRVGRDPRDLNLLESVKVVVDGVQFGRADARKRPGKEQQKDGGIEVFGQTPGVIFVGE
jgi:hypothetical protein